MHIGESSKSPQSSENENSDSDSGQSSCSSDEELQFGSLDIKEFNYRVKLGTKFCTCVTPTDEKSCIGIIDEISKEAVIVENINCKLNSIINCFNFAFKNMSELSNPYRLALTDSFYRMRHEVLFKILMMTLNLPSHESDTPFSNFGIDSNKTPDYICEVNGSLVVIEISVTSNFEKTAMMKGLSSHGYESKYEKEINELKSLGKIVNYIVFIFDMTSYNVKIHQEKIEENKDLFYVNKYFYPYLDLIYKEFCTITYNTKSYLYPVSSFLFTENVGIKKSHDKLKFCYNEKKMPNDYHYAKFNISQHVYSKINNSWHRILQIYEYFNRDFKGKYLPCLSLVNNKITFVEDRNGFDFEELRDIIFTNDKPSFFRKLNLSAGNVKFPASGSETGVEFIERVDKVFEELDEVYQMPSITNHVNTPVKRAFNKEKHYKDILKIAYENLYSSNYYDKNYEDLYIKKVKEFDEDCTGGSMDHEHFEANLGLGLLAENSLSELDIEKKMLEISRIYRQNNKFDLSLPVKVKKMKQSFILPIASLSSKCYSSLLEKNDEMLKGAYKCLESNEYTRLILLKIMDNNYSFNTSSNIQPSNNYLSLKKEKYEWCNKMTQLYKKNLNIVTGGDYKKYDKEIKTKLRLSNSENIEIKSTYEEYKNKISSLDKEILRVAKEENIKQNIEFIRLPTRNKNSVLGSYFSFESKHFKNKKSPTQATIEGFGMPDNYLEEYNYCSDLYEDLCDNLTEYRGNNPDFLIDLNVSDDVKLLKELKNKAVENYGGLINEIKDSYLGHSCSFISRLGHSLMFYSQHPFNSDYIRADNLGYNNCLLLVRGGKKIFKSKSSKMFRLIFPVGQEVYPYYIDDSVGDCSYMSFSVGSERFLISPWMMLHESILSDSISFYPRVMSFCILNLDSNLSFAKQFGKVSLNVLLAFHNRRQTEVFLANMRYILLSTMGDFSGIMDIFEEFCGFNYDRFQFYVRASVINNYSDYFKKMRSLQSENFVLNDNSLRNFGIINLFNGRPLEDLNSLTLMIYSTFLMTKGPYQRPAERAINLKGILKIHKQFDKEVGLSLGPKEQLEKISVSLDEDTSYLDYSRNLFSKDFNIDPKYIASMGVFANSYYQNLNLKDKLQTEWMKILNIEWDSMATSTGLRGSPSDVEDFWGKKGYFVVYKSLLKNEEYCKAMENMFDIEITNNSKLKLLKTLNQSFLEKIEGINYKTLIFHAVDKVQWRGSREIYVMDVDTKTMQQPIEKYMAFLCKNIDNELISIPTDKRAQVIHHSIFEKDLPLKDTLTTFLTLDCSKWAPKSMFVKFAIMLTSMPILPPSFVCHFLNYLESLYYKKIYFNVAEVEVLKNNEQYRELIEENLKFDENLKGYYLMMPYSWVMGIFNYTSSFMHAFNQKYASYLINKTSSLDFGKETSLVMFAHSDDSGGKMMADSMNLIKRGLILYEVQLKACNHLLSKKKSVVSKIYFEVLSIIYLFKKLMALLPKFLGGIRFNPTDKGPTHDMLTSYSKCVEVLIAGSDFTVAYLVMKLNSAMVWRFYYNKPPIGNDYKRPVQYFGMPDSHPLMVLLTGTDSDFIRIKSTGGSKLLRLLHKFFSEMDLNMDEEGAIKSFKFNIKVRNISKGFENSMERFNEIMKSWTIGNVNFKNTAFNALNFLKKLNDPGFVGSLVNETPVRRISRAYYLRKGDSVITGRGNFSLAEVFSAVRIITDLEINGESSCLGFLKDLLGDDFNKVYQSIEGEDEEDNVMMSVMNNTLAGPFRLNEYFNELSLENKTFNQVNRTLKPTQVQLLKIGSSFSINFDAAQLVSYIKEPEYRWALPDLKNLKTAEQELLKLLSYLNLDINRIDCSTLLKLIRMHVVKTHKDIYLYSQVPSEIRNIKTYASLLMFLSCNSFRDYEISGLSLKLSSSLTDPGYVGSEINEDIFHLNTLLSVILIIKKGKFNISTDNVRIKKIESIGWEEGTMTEFLEFLSNSEFKIIDFEHIKLYIDYIKESSKTDEPSSKILENKSFYIFLKEQKRRGGWQGVGKLLINIGKKFYIFSLLGSSITSVESNNTGKIDSLSRSFIMEVCVSNGINISANYMLPNNKIGTEDSFGYDHVGDLSITSKKDIARGVSFKQLKRPPLFINQIDFGSIKHIRENIFSVVMNVNDEVKKYKLYGLKINKANLIKTIRTLFYESDFKRNMIEEGVDNINEFILTELLSDFNEDVNINMDEFFDNIFSSELYKIFNFIKSSDSSILPKKIKTSDYPAESGSLQRILLTYGEETENNIIKNYKNYDPMMFSIRNEYSENFSMVLSEKLVESHRRLFDKQENEEMLNSYINLIKIEDKDEMRKNLINLMCYWGYGSLVNSINVYDFSKNKRNYSMVLIRNNQAVSVEYYLSLFCLLAEKIVETMLQFSSIFQSLEFPIKGLCENLDMYTVIHDYIKFLCLIPYGYKFVINMIDIQNAMFINTFMALLKVEDFCEKLTESMSTHQLFKTLPISYENREEMMAFFNTLKCIFMVNLNINHNLDYVVLTERLPENVMNPYVLMKRIFSNPALHIIKKKDMIYHHGFLNNFLVDKMKSKINLDSGNKRFKITQRISDLSDVYISMREELKIIRPLNEEFLESETWEELNQELSFVDIDIETIEDIWENKDTDPYVKKETHFKGNTVLMKLNWVIYPFCEGKKRFLDQVRQIGENIIIMTTSFINFNCFPNSHVFLTNFSSISGGNLPYVFLYCTGNKSLNRQFWKDLIGENEFKLPIDLLSPLNLKKVNTEAGISETNNLGSLSGEDILTMNTDALFKEIEQRRSIADDSINAFSKDKDQSSDKIKKSELEVSKEEEIKNKLDEAVKEGLINSKMAEKISEKYKDTIVRNKIDLEKMLEALLGDIDLNSLNNIFLQVLGKGELTKKEIVHIYQSPRHFGVTHSTDSDAKNPLLNSKVRAELESLCLEISRKIASGTLTISDKMIKLVRASFKIWKSFIISTSCKKENKKFLLKLFNSIVNGSHKVGTGEDDFIWNNLINNTQLLIAQDDDDDDDDEAGDDEFKFDYNIISSSRLRYRLSGFF
jgi:hypothetical protein